MAQALKDLPNITKTPNWTINSVMAACCRYDLYNAGDNAAYTAMLQKVAQFKNPSDVFIFMIAEDIAKHSHCQTVSNVMYILANEAITYTFEINGRDDI